MMPNTQKTETTPEEMLTWLDNTASDFDGVNITMLQATREAVKDAVRYRWLRDSGQITFLKRGEEVNKLVDAEMAKPREEIII